MITSFDEFSRKVYIPWEDIKAVCGYPYSNETWVNFPEPKFFIELHEGRNILVLGNIETMIENWKTYRLAVWNGFK